MLYIMVILWPQGEQILKAKANHTQQNEVLILPTQRLIHELKEEAYVKAIFMCISLVYKYPVFFLSRIIQAKSQWVLKAKIVYFQCIILKIAYIIYGNFWSILPYYLVCKYIIHTFDWLILHVTQSFLHLTYLKEFFAVSALIFNGKDIHSTQEHHRSAPSRMEV